MITGPRPAKLERKAANMAIAVIVPNVKNANNKTVVPEIEPDAAARHGTA